MVMLLLNHSGVILVLFRKKICYNSLKFIWAIHLFSSWIFITMFTNYRAYYKWINQVFLINTSPIHKQLPYKFRPPQHKVRNNITAIPDHSLLTHKPTNQWAFLTCQSSLPQVGSKWGSLMVPLWVRKSSPLEQSQVDRHRLDCTLCHYQMSRNRRHTCRLIHI